MPPYSITNTGPGLFTYNARDGLWEPVAPTIHTTNGTVTLNNDTVIRANGDGGITSCTPNIITSGRTYEWPATTITTTGSTSNTVYVEAARVSKELFDQLCGIQTGYLQDDSKIEEEELDQILGF